MRLRSPDEKLDTSGVEEQSNSRRPSRKMLDHLDAVQMQAVAKQALTTVSKHGPMTIAAIAEKHPLHYGLEELVAYLRVAKAVGATSLPEKESIIFNDKQGIRLQAAIPALLLSADLFPKNLDELIL